jgi:hypothetical protein
VRQEIQQHIDMSCRRRANPLNAAGKNALFGTSRDGLAKHGRSFFPRVHAQAFDVQRIDRLRHDRAVTADLAKQVRVQPELIVRCTQGQSALQSIVAPGLAGVRQQGTYEQPSSVVINIRDASLAVSDLFRENVQDFSGGEHVVDHLDNPGREVVVSMSASAIIFRSGLRKARKPGPAAIAALRPGQSVVRYELDRLFTGPC